MPAAALVFAGKAVATPAISFLVNKAFAYLNQYWNIGDAGEMKNRILNGLPKIQAVFDVINQDRVKEKSIALEALLWQLRDAVDKAQDAVDEIEYYELKERAEDRKVSDWGSSFAKMRHSAIRSVKHASIVDKVVKRLSHRGTLRRLKRALEGLDKAASGVGDFLAIAGYRDGSTSRQQEDFQDRYRETGSMITAKMFGRRKEKEQVIGWLTMPSSVADAEIEEINNSVSIVSIVGHGGMGKTTLAQHICEDDFVKGHFEKVIWACVSTSFTAKDIIRKILGSAGWEAPSANQLDPLQKILREKLNSLKFLLVLDDVWEDKDEGQWEKLLAPLRTGKSGSKIILTTRMKEVAELAGKVMRCKNDCKELQSLEEDDNRDLFEYYALSRSGIQDYAALEPIGEQISRKLRGCPLVTKVMASDLRDHLDIQYWSNFLDERLKHFEGSDADIMNILKRSYYHLPTEVQTCFRYCSIFPQDYAFTKAELVEMWLSSGLILQTEPQRCPMDLASDCLCHLTKKSFFDVKIFEGMDCEIIEKYVMHDLMHDLAKCVSLGECARIDGVASLENVVRTVRHICFGSIYNLPVEKLKPKISRLENLRSIIIEEEEDGPNQGQGNKDVLDTVEKLVESSKSLRLFKTKSWHTSCFPEKLAKLMHLRFVELQNTSQESMSGVFRLYHLTTLRWKSVKVESRQVRDVGYLDRLRNLSYGPDGCSMVPVGRLSSLRILVLHHIRRSKGYNISVLKDLRSLQKLHLQNLENVDNQEEAVEALLKEKKDLKSLQLEWSSSSNGSPSRTEELILEKLEPPADLKKLCISGFSGSTFPHWIAEPSVKKLVSLAFKICKNIQEVVILEKFQDLKHLTLYHLPRLERISQALNFSGAECTEVFLPPCLRKMEVVECSKLEELPLLPPSLERLEIKHVGLTRLPRIRTVYKNGQIVSSKLLSIVIGSCPNLTSLEGSLFEQKQHMGVVRYLRVMSCVNLESAHLPLEEMNGLREMHINKCPKLRMLRSAEDKLQPSSLEALTLGQCGDLELILLESLEVFNNLYDLSLCIFSVIVSLPSADVFMNMKSLRRMSLMTCENLSSLGGLGSLPRLLRHEFNYLEIWNCSKLTEAGLRLVPSLEVSGCEEEARSFMKIKRIDIDHPSLLLLELLKNLRPTDRLHIWGGLKMLDVIKPWLLQNCTSLRFLLIFELSLELLPASLRHLSNLKSLDVYSDQLRALSNLPSSLESLCIPMCHPELRKKATGYGSLKWNEISHITEVQIGDRHFRNGVKYKRRAVEHDGEFDSEFILGVILEDPNKTRFCCSTALCLSKSR